MLASIWDFLKDANNQAVLSWIGGGIVVIAAAIWAVVKFVAKKPSASADRGGVAIVGDVKNSPINTRDTNKP
jgi:hypothetical protein